MSLTLHSLQGFPVKKLPMRIPVPEVVQDEIIQVALEVDFCISNIRECLSVKRGLQVTAGHTYTQYFFVDSIHQCYYTYIKKSILRRISTAILQISHQSI